MAYLSIKRLQVDKDSKKLVLISAASAVVIAFSIVASFALLSQRSYQQEVIGGKEAAVQQLEANVAAVESLVTSYKTFIDTPENIIGGSVEGSGDNDGDNAKIVLDALPSRYDFPALATSLEKILTDGNFRINSISGTDEELTQNLGEDQLSQPIEIPFQVSVTGNYDSVMGLFNTLDRSIRPFNVQKISLSGTTDTLTLVVSAKTFYQPEKTVLITTKEVQ